MEDRRRFVDDAEPPPAAEATKPEASHAPAEHAATPPQAEEAISPHTEAHQEINFTTFVMGLTTQALMHLGEIAEPGQPNARDLPAAKQMIDLLGILRDKTTGNLDAAEEQLLASHQQLRNLSAHLQSVREEERVKIAREIHDELGQVLTVAKPYLSGG